MFDSLLFLERVSPFGGVDGDEARVATRAALRSRISAAIFARARAASSLGILGASVLCSVVAIALCIGVAFGFSICIGAVAAFCIVDGIGALALCIVGGTVAHTGIVVLNQVILVVVIPVVV